MVYPTRQELENLEINKMLDCFRRSFHPSAVRMRDWIRDLNFMDKVKPRPNSYFYWHFKRIADTVYDFVIPNFHQASTLLDIASNPHFWLLLKQKCKGKIICTSIKPESKELFFEPTGEVYYYNPIKFVIGEGTIPLEDKNVDVVILSEVIEHLKIHPQNLLCDIHRVLRPEGKLILTTPNLLSWKKLCGLLFREQHPYDSTCYGGFLSHHYEYTPYQLLSLLKHIGYKIIHFETRNVYLNDGIPFTGKILRTQHIFNLATTFKLKLLYKQFQRFNSTILIVAQKNSAVANETLYDL